MTIESPNAAGPRLFPHKLEDRLTGLLYRIAGAALVVLCVIGWVTLLTWSASDPSLSHATGTTPRNFLGPLGAIISDLMLQTMGLTAIFALLAPMVWGVQFATREYVPRLKLKILAYPVSILVLAGALSSLPLVQNWPLNHGFGGILGDLVLGLATSLLSFINPQRAAVVAGMMYFTGGFAALFASIGMTQNELQMIWRRSPGQTRFEGSNAEIGRDGVGSVVDWRTTGAGLTEAVVSKAGAVAATNTVASGIMAFLKRSKSRLEPVFARAGVSAGGPDPGFCPADAECASQSWGHGSSFSTGKSASRQREMEPGSDHRSSHEAAGGDNGFEPAFDFGVKRDTILPDAEVVERGRSFVEATDKKSRSMAQRFAPASAAGTDDTVDEEIALASSDTDTATGSRNKSARKGFLSSLKARRAVASAYRRPSLNMLKRASNARPGPEFTQTVLRGNARLLEDVLGDFGIKGEIKDIRPGPVVTTFELEPARGTKSSRVISLGDDIARSMSATSARVAVVPGRNAMGIELPNMRREMVLLRELLESDTYRSGKAALPLALGKSINGDAVVADLARMPHLLVAGTTGSGKSVGVNAMILSILYSASPQDCRFLMIDPKMLELSVYNGIPHLLCPVVTDPHKAVAALGWAVREMEERYKRMSQLGVRNIEVFNNRVRNAAKRGEALARTVQTGFDQHSGQAIYEKEEFDLEPMPFIVVVVDEFADLMTVAGKDIEAHVQRLAQMARAAGIHLIMATQRPSVDIITGTIKANFPTRISYKVTSKIDSRTILNEQGAEQLLGHGDMLFADGSGPISRVHGPFVSDEEIEQIAAWLRDQGGPDYIEGITGGEGEPDSDDSAGAPGSTARGSSGNDADDALYDRAVAIVLRDQKASISYVQRRLSIGYNRAADLVERMERDAVVSAANTAGKRQILIGNEGSQPREN